MTYVVAEPCINCRYTDCVAVCPVNCFHMGNNFLAIDPDVCIDCGACEPVCPANAIYGEADLPEKWSEFVTINAELAKKWPVLSQQREPLPGANKWKDKKDKLRYLDWSTPKGPT